MVSRKINVKEITWEKSIFTYMLKKRKENKAFSLLFKEQNIVIKTTSLLCEKAFSTLKIEESYTGVFLVKQQQQLTCGLVGVSG